MKQSTSPNHLRFIEQYYSQEQISDILGISPRYQRLIKEGKRTGAKYADAIRGLYELIRRSERPPQKRRRPPRRKEIATYVFVPDMLNVLFSIFEPRTWKIPKRPYQHRGSLFFVNEAIWPSGEMYNTWDSFFIVAGVIPEADPRFRKYRRVLEIVEEDEDEEEGEREEKEADSIEMFIEMLEELSEREKNLISHLNLESKLSDLYIQGIPEDSPLFINFWISRVSTAPTSPSDAFNLMTEIAKDSIDIANSESDDVQYFLVGVYGFSGWNQ